MNGNQWRDVSFSILRYRNGFWVGISSLQKFRGRHSSATVEIQHIILITDLFLLFLRTILHLIEQEMRNYSIDNNVEDKLTEALYLLL